MSCSDYGCVARCPLLLLCLWVPSRIRQRHIFSGYRSLRKSWGMLMPASSLPLFVFVALATVSMRRYLQRWLCSSTVYQLYYMHPTDCLLLPSLCSTLLTVSCCSRCPANCRRSMEPTCVLQSINCTTYNIIHTTLRLEHTGCGRAMVT